MFGYYNHIPTLSMGEVYRSNIYNSTFLFSSILTDENNLTSVNSSFLRTAVKQNTGGSEVLIKNDSALEESQTV